MHPSKRAIALIDGDDTRSVRASDLRKLLTDRVEIDIEGFLSLQHDSAD